MEWLSSGDSQAYSSSESETKEFFNRVAPEWEDIRRGYYDESVKNKLVEMKLLKSGMTVMDLGAGDGYLSRAVARYVKKVVAVDISAEMLRELAKKAASESIANIETLESDGCDVPVDDASMEILCPSMYLHHIEEPEQAVKEIKRVLKPGGKVFLADFKEHSNKELKEKMHDVWQGFSADEIREWFTKCGFREIKMESLPNIFIMTAVK